MSIDLEALGFTREELQEKVIDRICKQFLGNYSWDEDGERDWEDSLFAKKLQQRVKDQVDTSIDRLAQQHVLPNVDRYIENVTLQETNRWGEKRGTPMTFKEYLAQRAEHYLTEKVNHRGEAKRESDSSYFDGKQTRITYLIDQYLSYAISSALKSALDSIDKTLTNGIQGTIRAQLEALSKNVQIVVKR